jgi:DNA-binding MarR family transcriptional regulator
MTSTQLSPQIGRIILAQLEEQPKYESAIEIEGFRMHDAWDRARITTYLQVLEARGFVAREPSPAGRRTLGGWKTTSLGLESMTRGDFLAAE